MADLSFPQFPNKMEPGPVEVSNLAGELYPDCRRVHVTVLTQGEGHRPNMDFKISDANGAELCHSVIVENYDQKTEFTMHLQRPDFVQPITLFCKAYFENSEFFAEKSVQITAN